MELAVWATTVQYQGVLRCPWYPQQQLRYVGEAPNFHTNPKSDKKKKPGSGIERSPVEVVIDWNTIVCIILQKKLGKLNPARSAGTRMATKITSWFGCTVARGYLKLGDTHLPWLVFKHAQIQTSFAAICWMWEKSLATPAVGINPWLLVAPRPTYPTTHPDHSTGNRTRHLIKSGSEKSQKLIACSRIPSNISSGARKSLKHCWLLWSTML